MPIQDTEDGLLHPGVEMDGVCELHVRVAIDEVSQGAAQLEERLAEAFAAMGRDEDELAAVEPGEQGLGARVRAELLRSPAEGVDHRVASDRHILGGDTLAEQSATR